MPDTGWPLVWSGPVDIVAARRAGRVECTYSACRGLCWQELGLSSGGRRLLRSLAQQEYASLGLSALSAWSAAKGAGAHLLVQRIAIKAFKWRRVPSVLAAPGSHCQSAARLWEKVPGQMTSGLLH